MGKGGQWTQDVLVAGRPRGSTAAYNGKHGRSQIALQRLDSSVSILRNDH